MHALNLHLGNLLAVSSRNALAFIVDIRRDAFRIVRRTMKNADQYADDKIKRRIVVVMEHDVKPQNLNIDDADIFMKMTIPLT